MRLAFLTLLTLAIIVLAPPGSGLAQNEAPVQELFGSLAAGQIDVYRIAGLKQGQTLHPFVENISGNLDPIIVTLHADENLSARYESYKKDLAELLASSPCPILDLPNLWAQYFLAWDDDSGPGYSAALEFTIPSDIVPKMA